MEQRRQDGESGQTLRMLPVRTSAIRPVCMQNIQWCIGQS